MCPNMGSIFTEIYLPKSKPFILDILYRLPYKTDFANYIDQIFNQFDKLETQECYLLEENLLFKGEEIFSNKITKAAQKDMPKNIFRIFLILENK